MTMSELSQHIEILDKAAMSQERGLIDWVEALSGVLAAAKDEGNERAVRLRACRWYLAWCDRRPPTKWASAGA